MKSFSFVIIILLCQLTINCSKSLQFVGDQEIVNETNFVVSIQTRYTHVCCGSIIAAKWVLTVDFCIKVDIKNYRIRYGVLNCYEWNMDKNHRARSRNIVYKISSYHETVSLLKVDRPFNKHWFGDFGILSSPNDNISDHGFVYGWDITGDSTDLLKRVAFNITQMYSYTSYQFRAGGNGTGISLGNIGSPFVSENKIMGVASSVSSFTGEYPGMFYLVSAFLEWIENEMNETNLQPYKIR